MQAINPATEKPLQVYKDHHQKEIGDIIENTHTAFMEWRTNSFESRSRLLKRLAEVLRASKAELARLITEEMGKPLRDSEGELEKCAWVCEYYAKHGASFLQDEMIETEASRSYVSYQPLGVVLAIMPWNFPFWQVLRFAAPALMAGNAVLLKHAPNVPGCAHAMERLFTEAGFPACIFRNLFISIEETEKVIEHPLVKAVTLTGSTRAGKAVAQKAGSVLKKCVLELGGSDPYVILEDADIDLAVKECVNSRLINNGQSCISAKRIIVHQSVVEEFVSGMKELMQGYSFGDPMDPSSQLGPLVGKKYREELHRQVEQSIDKGANCLLGGAIPDGRGFYYPPTILTGVQKGMPAFDEELFGPVAAVITVKSEEEAFEVANDTVYGLGGAVFSRDPEKAETLANTRLNSGSCFVNAFVKSDPRLPFGGINESGYGRELSSHGIREFTNIKTVYVR